MAKMHWFILGGMFTEIKPDSVKEKYTLQHEKPYPSSKASSAVCLTDLHVYTSTLPLVLFCHFSVYIIMCFQFFSFDKSNSKRLQQIFFLPQI